MDYNNELPPQQGWICPKCGRVNAPWMPTCGCVSSQTSGTPIGGKWTDIYQIDANHLTGRCSNCRERTIFCGYFATNFCPNCGADMREREMINGTMP